MMRVLRMFMFVCLVILPHATMGGGWGNRYGGRNYGSRRGYGGSTVGNGSPASGEGFSEAGGGCVQQQEGLGHEEEVRAPRRTRLQGAAGGQRGSLRRQEVPLHRRRPYPWTYFDRSCEENEDAKNHHYPT